MCVKQNNYSILAQCFTLYRAACTVSDYWYPGLLHKLY